VKCSAKCGVGYRNRSIFCVYNNQRVVDNDYCDEALKPTVVEECNTNECPIQWRVGSWSEVIFRVPLDFDEKLNDLLVYWSAQTNVAKDTASVRSFA
jgi:hypothetical protein